MNPDLPALNAAVTLAITRAEGMDHEHAALWEAVASAERALVEAGAALSEFEQSVAQEGYYRARVKADILRHHFAACFDENGVSRLPLDPEDKP